MKNDDLIFSTNGIASSNVVKLHDRNFLFVNTRNSFDGRTINEIIRFVNKMEKKNPMNKVPVLFKIGAVSMVDKLTYIIFECICNYLINNNRRVYIEFEPQKSIYTDGIDFSPLFLLRKNQKDASEEYKKKFIREIYESRYRRVVKVEEDKDEYLLSKIMTDLDTFLKRFSVIKLHRDAISEVVVELVGNALEHASTDCLIDLDVTDEYKKEDSEGDFFGINITIVNFCSELLGHSISQKIRKKELMNERHLKLLDAYKEHSKFFNSKYNENDFYTIATFQHKISGRLNNESTGGTGLTKLIQRLESYSDAYLCYVITGNRALFFSHDYLNYNTEGWIGFNSENDFLSNPPSEDILDLNTIYMPGTGYNLNFVMKIEEENK